MIDSFWPDRRTIQSISVTTARRGSHLAMASLPILRWLQQTVHSQFSRTPNRPCLKVYQGELTMTNATLDLPVLETKPLSPLCPKEFSDCYRGLDGDA